jgi:ribosomal protein L40E
MWIRKTQTEIANDEAQSVLQRKKLGWPALWALVISVGFPMAWALGFSTKYSHRQSRAFSEEVKAVPMEAVVLFPLAFGVLVYSRRSGSWEKENVETAICPSCHHVQAANAEGCVRCGSQLEPFRFWRWTESEEQ